MIDLSICIPVYNNIHLFRHCLDAIGQAVRGIESRVEIVVSDNASEDNISGCVDHFCENYPQVQIRVHRNETNKGIAYNIVNAASLARGTYCWIIGSDDFVLAEGVSSILQVIDSHTDVDFIAVEYLHLFLEQIKDVSHPTDLFHRIPDKIRKKDGLVTRKVKMKTGRVARFDFLVDPGYDNVMLGAIMAGVFRRTRWMSVPIDTDAMNLSNVFVHVENAYPHCVVYAQSMIGRPAYFLGTPVIVVGEGARDWMGDNIWDGYLPVIYLEIFNEIVDVYQASGLDRLQVNKCREYTSEITGMFFFSYLYRRYILRKQIKRQQHIHLIKIIHRNWSRHSFYRGIRTSYKNWRRSRNNKGRPRRA